jgi:hypothetical protein
MLRTVTLASSSTAAPILARSFSTGLSIEFALVACRATSSNFGAWSSDHRRQSACVGDSSIPPGLRHFIIVSVAGGIFCLEIPSCHIIEHQKRSGRPPKTKQSLPAPTGGLISGQRVSGVDTLQPLFPYYSQKVAWARQLRFMVMLVWGLLKQTRFGTGHMEMA